MEDTDYALGRTSAEYDRLTEQADLLRPLTERMLRAAGIGPGMHVLDVGCGMGDVSFLVSELVGPEGSVVGVDLDLEVLCRADGRRTMRGIQNVRFQEGDARSVASDRSFDAAVGRFVLMYMSDPTAALRHLAKRVRSGGILAFHEWDAGCPSTSASRLPVLASLQSLLVETWERSGARADTGGHLYTLMSETGLMPASSPLAEIAMCAGDADTVYRRWASMARSLLPKIVEYGLASEQSVLDIVERQLHDELRGARGLLPLSWLMIGQWACKP